MTLQRKRLGREGERLALETVVNLGYVPVDINYRCRLGELDLVAKDGDTLVFIEIKTRRDFGTESAKSAVDRQKQRRLSRLALNYLKTHGGLDVKARFDVIAVSLGHETPIVEIVRNAFELAY